MTGGPLKLFTTLPPSRFFFLLFLSPLSSPPLSFPLYLSLTSFMQKKSEYMTRTMQEAIAKQAAGSPVTPTTITMALTQYPTSSFIYSPSPSSPSLALSLYPSFSLFLFFFFIYNFFDVCLCILSVSRKQVARGWKLILERSCRKTILFTLV